MNTEGKGKTIFTAQKVKNQAGHKNSKVGCFSFNFIILIARL